MGIGFLAGAQQTVRIKLAGGENNAAVSGTVLLKGRKTGYTTDTLGVATVAFPSNGTYILLISAAGYQPQETTLAIPYNGDTLVIELKSEEHELDEIIVQSTRTSRSIANVPTRIETIALEEIDEKTNMRPSNVAMLLHESTGVQVQQTSATSGNAGIRLQGLDGRYTQLLKDGFANFGAFSSGLSVLEIPPLDLRQVEIIKGPASPLFGGGAIAGVVNFISKTPRTAPEYSFILNQSNIGQSNVGGFASGKSKRAGYTVLALYNRQAAYDVDGDDFTEVPKSDEFTLHPKLFLYPSANTSIVIGNSFTNGERTGGDIQVIKGRADAAHQYIEKNKTLRNISTFELTSKPAEGKQWVAKQSFSVFDRSIAVPSYSFSGIDYTAYTDISYVTNGPHHSFVAGGNFIYNGFREEKASSGGRDNTTKTGGLYAQHTWDATDKIKLESGLRVDAAGYNNSLYSTTEVFLLPRVSLLVKYSPQWSSRIGGGMGYKTPTLFTEETETVQYQNVAQLNNVTSEKSYGGTADVNFRTSLGDNLGFTLNHLLFYTRIDRPLVLQTNGVGMHRFSNADKPVQTMGFETNARLIYKEDFKLFLGYTFTHTKAGHLTGNRFLPLVPRGKLNSALIYEKEGRTKLGLEGYFTGRQWLSNGKYTPPFSELGFMAEKIFNRFSLFINLENFTDTRQSRYKSVVNGSHLSPTFDEIWTHTEGFVVNGGVKLKL